MIKQPLNNANRGAIFKNLEKQDPKHADYRGELNAAGVNYWVSAWINESKKGAKYLALRLKPKNPPAEKPELDDSIPF
jgi:hypothetical protein